MINFLKYWPIYLITSCLIISIGVFAIWRYGLVLSIDFTGGSVSEYQFDKNIENSKVEAIVRKQNINLVLLQSEGQDYKIQTGPIDEKQELALREELKNELGLKKIELKRFESVGATLGTEKLQKTAIAALISAIGILLYMLFAFKKITHGLSAVIAMLHDTLILFGMYVLLTGLFGAQIDTLFVTAVLTTAAFSVHDTIVVFDKIRELQKHSGEDIGILANKALTETMVRSVNNSLTIILMLIPLAIFGGETIRFFAAALLIGTISGTYSSPFIATPVLVGFEKLGKRRGRGA